MPNFGHSDFLPGFFAPKWLEKFGTPNFGCSEFLAIFLHQMVGKTLECLILAILNFLNLCTSKWLEKSRMSNFGCSKFLPVFLHQNGWTKLECPILAILNSFYFFDTKMVGKMWNAQIEFLPVFLAQDWTFQIFSSHFSAKIL